MRIAIATDAWFPQINGVVRTLAATVDRLNHRGHEVELITPDLFMTVPMPGYNSIRLAIAPRFNVRRLLWAWRPDIVHIATEGPIGWSARGWCLSHDVPFTTAFHTRFPDYASVRTGIKADRFWPVMRRFHQPSRAVLCATDSLQAELQFRGIRPTVAWGRGIDHTLFHDSGDLHSAISALPRPILLNVGRVSPEKNLEAFLDLPFAGSKVVVGDGPALETLRSRYPDVHFLGAMSGPELAAAYRSADCFVFPSKTDTFGLVVIEALACGLPVAAYPVAGPIDILGPDGYGTQIFTDGPAGALDCDLAKAIAIALSCRSEDAVQLGRVFSWDSATDQFVSALEAGLADQPYEAELEPA